MPPSPRVPGGVTLEGSAVATCTAELTGCVPAAPSALQVPPTGGLQGALSCSAPVTSLQGTQIKSPHHQQAEEGLEDGNHRLRPPAAPDMNLGQGSGVCPNLLLHPSDPVTGQMLPLPRHQIPSPALLQGGQRNGTEKPPPKTKKNNPLWFIHHSGLSFHQAIPAQTEGESATGKPRLPHFSAFKGKKQPGASKRGENFATAAGSRLERLPARSTGAAKSGPSHIPSPATELPSSSIY